jgi:Ran GTPase-activating protein (RanGAP) involved in mRNA processing and transport
MRLYILTKLCLAIMAGFFKKKFTFFQFSEFVELSEGKKNTENTAEEEEEEEEEDEEDIADFSVAYATSGATSTASCKH